MRDICQHHRRWDAANGAFDYEVSCPYRGTGYFNAKGAESKARPKIAAASSSPQAVRTLNGVLPFRVPGVQ